MLGSSLTDPDINDTIPPVLVVDSICGNINGYVYEKPNFENVGIDYCYVDANLTVNYNYSVVGSKDTATVFYFSGTLKDPDSEAIYTLISRDKNGNIKKFIYNYYPVKFANANSQLLLGNVDWKDSICYDLWTKNTSKSTNSARKYLLS